MKSQDQWLDSVKTNGCWGCHAIGTKATRTIPEALGHFNSSYDAWTRRIQSGQAMTSMISTIGRFGTQRGLAMFADWTDRIAGGELPFAKPERPQGIERNLVISLWDWGRPNFYLHSEVSTDRRNPTINPNGKVYGSPEYSTDYLPVLDPVANAAAEQDRATRSQDAHLEGRPDGAFGLWGAEPSWDSQTNTHDPMMDQQGRVWYTSQIRPPENPAFCQAGSDHPSAKLFPSKTSYRQGSMFDPKTGKFTLINTCFDTHHLHFAEDADNTLYFSGGRQMLGWIDTKTFDATHDEQKSQGWTAFVVDTNGDGKRGEYTEPNQPLRPEQGPAPQRQHLRHTGWRPTARCRRSGCSRATS